MTVKFELLPDKEVWFLNSKPGEQPEITKSSQDEPQIIFSLSQETLPAIYLGEMTALTEMGREIMSDLTPLDFTLGKVISTTGRRSILYPTTIRPCPLERGSRTIMFDLSRMGRKGIEKGKKINHECKSELVFDSQ